MPKRYQDPSLEKRTDVAQPFWFVRVRLRKGEPRRPLKLGFVKDMNLKQAKKKRAEVLTAVNSGLLISQARCKFHELVERFENGRVPQFAVPTQKWYVSLIHGHILPAFGDRQLADIDAAMVEGWLTGKEREGLSWWSRKGLRSVMSNIFATAIKWDMWTGKNPVENVTVGRKRLVREKRLVTSEQFRAILVGVGDQTQFMILIASLVGLRISEVLGLRWSDVDFEKRTLAIERRWYRGDVDELKSEARRGTRGIGPLAGEFQRRYPGPHKRDEYVFLGDEGGNPPDERDILRYELRPILKKLGIYYPGCGWHIYKRAHITYRQTVGGATPVEAQKAGGHSSLDMTCLYSLSDMDREQEQVTKVYDFLMGAAPTEVKQ